ncbi:hypothetical protein AK812_SmicGene34340 [Symbiodinium microadriaticum]|uniref:Uncharacterized protein n=1 Tax=Symbiodinium microadriaticum TaxID=2951 RepID=A0A1Q9CPA3_SYMMI|nr:hypothetical protein AK812_SmicGene34340 [Symbiodinium microadriaticum]
MWLGRHIIDQVLEERPQPPPQGQETPPLSREERSSHIPGGKGPNVSEPWTGEVLGFSKEIPGEKPELPEVRRYFNPAWKPKVRSRRQPRMLVQLKVALSLRAGNEPGGAGVLAQRGLNLALKGVLGYLSRGFHDSGLPGVEGNYEAASLDLRLQSTE